MPGPSSTASSGAGPLKYATSRSPPARAHSRRRLRRYRPVPVGRPCSSRASMPMRSSVPRPPSSHDLAVELEGAGRGDVPAEELAALEALLSLRLRLARVVEDALDPVRDGPRVER